MRSLPASIFTRLRSDLCSGRKLTGVRNTHFMGQITVVTLIVVMTVWAATQFLEAGERNPTIMSLWKLAVALDVTLEELIHLRASSMRRSRMGRGHRGTGERLM